MPFAQMRRAFLLEEIMTRTAAIYWYVCQCGYKKMHCEDRSAWHCRRCPRCNRVMWGVKSYDV